MLEKQNLKLLICNVYKACSLCIQSVIYLHKLIIIEYETKYTVFAIYLKSGEILSSNIYFPFPVLLNC